MLGYIENECEIKEIKQEARKYCVITCVSAMEVFYKRTAEEFIDFNWAKDDIIELLKQEKITIADLIEIEHKSLTTGEIVSAYYNFADINSINRFFSKMFGVADFIRGVEKTSIITEDGLKVILKDAFPDYRKRVQETISLRHQIVHHEGYKGVFGIKRLIDMYRNVHAFVMASDFYILDKIPED